MVHRYPESIRLAWWRVIVPVRLKRKGIEVEKSARFQGMPIVSMVPNSEIKIGARSSLCSVSTYTALGVNHPMVLRTMRGGARLVIGADTGISGASICAAIEVKIGDNCLLGANVTIADTDFHALSPHNRRYNTRPNEIAAKPVHIGNNVFLGAGVIVLKGVTIGDNAVVGAGSVVVCDIPANVVAAGNPAHVVRSLVTSTMEKYLNP
jgi:acetyltransferase-like isoleucine patch superfamily enzyme